MSKHNKANKDHYNQAGRLTPDELAREQAKQRQSNPGRGDELFRGQSDPSDAPATPRRRDGHEGSE